MSIAAVNPPQIEFDRASQSPDFSESALAREELAVQEQRRGSLVRQFHSEDAADYLIDDGRRQNEGDMDLYTKENVRRRLAAFEQPRVQELLEWWWRGARGDDADGDGLLQFDEYAQIYGRLVAAFNDEDNPDDDDADDLTEEQARQALSQDWAKDSGGDGTVDGPDFKRSIFEMADTWTESCDPLEYVRFLQLMFVRLFGRLRQQGAPMTASVLGFLEACEAEQTYAASLDEDSGARDEFELLDGRARDVARGLPPRDAIANVIAIPGGGPGGEQFHEQRRRRWQQHQQHDDVPVTGWAEDDHTDAGGIPVGGASTARTAGAPGAGGRRDAGDSTANNRPEAGRRVPRGIWSGASYTRDGRLLLNRPRPPPSDAHRAQLRQRPLHPPAQQQRDRGRGRGCGPLRRHQQFDDASRPRSPHHNRGHCCRCTKSATAPSFDESDDDYDFDYKDTDVNHAPSSAQY